jgi:hypothetical protein
MRGSMCGRITQKSNLSYFFGITISSPTIEGRWWAQTMGNVPTLSAAS